MTGTELTEEDGEWGFYSNPATNEVNFTNIPLSKQLVVSDLSGQVVLWVSPSVEKENEIEVNISKLNPVLYFINTSDYYMKRNLKLIKK